MEFLRIETEARMAKEAMTDLWRPHRCPRVEGPAMMCVNLVASASIGSGGSVLYHTALLGPLQEKEERKQQL